MACELPVQARDPHIIVLPFPSQGHVIPAIHFAEIMASEGCIITFVCAEYRIAWIRKSHGRKLNPSIRLIGLPDEVPPTMGAHDIDLQGAVQGFERILRIAENMAPAFERTLHGLIEDSKEEGSVSSPLCIASDSHVSWSQDIAAKYNIPRYVFFPSPCSYLAVGLYLPRLIGQGMIPMAANVRHLLIPGLPLFNSSDIPRSLHQDCPQARRDFSILNLLELHRSSGILVNTLYELEGEAIDAVRTDEINPNKLPIYPVGPVNFFKHERMDEEAALSDAEYSKCLKWLDAQAPSSVLYISFGSVAILSIPQLQEIAKALDGCQQAFLWVLRLPPSATEATVFPPDFLCEIHSRGLIISTWAPQLLILSHPSTGGFMSHCGWNSTLESICSGVPILPLPQFAEQEMISRMVTEVFKVGAKLERGADGAAESGEIEISIRELMQGEERGALRRARALKEKATRAVAEGGSSHTAFRAFIQNCKCYTHS